MSESQEKREELKERINKAIENIEEYKRNDKPCFTIKDKHGKNIKEVKINIMEKYLDKLKEDIDIIPDKEIPNYEECIENIEIIISILFGDKKIIINVLNKTFQHITPRQPKPQPPKQSPIQFKKTPKKPPK